MLKNIASQKVSVYAFDSITGLAKTGDAANITAYISKDGAAPGQSNDVNPAELDSTNMPGIYVFDLTQAETNCNDFVICSASTTANVVVSPVRLSVLVFDASGRVDVGKIAGSAINTASAQLGVNIVSCSPAGLDNISITEPSGRASTFREMIVQLYARFFNKVTLDNNHLKVYKNNNSLNTTQNVSDSGTTQTVEKA